MGLLSLQYRRPKKVDSETYQQRREGLEEAAEGSVKSGVSGASSGIPDALSFDRIINGGTCPVRLPDSSFQICVSNVC